MNRLISNSLAVVALIFATGAHAQWYVGATGGAAKTKLNAEGLNVQFLDLGYTAVQVKRDERGDAGRIYGGYQFNRFLALEAGYTDLGAISFGANVTPAGTFEKRIKTAGYDVSAVLMYPVLDKLSVFARVGAFNSERKTDITATGSVEILSGLTTASKDKQSKTTFGAGLNYSITPNILLRVEYAEYRKYEDELLEGSQNIKTAMLGLSYRFK